MKMTDINVLEDFSSSFNESFYSNRKTYWEKVWVIFSEEGYTKSSLEDWLADCQVFYNNN